MTHSQTFSAALRFLSLTRVWSTFRLPDKRVPRLVIEPSFALDLVCAASFVWFKGLLASFVFSEGVYFGLSVMTVWFTETHGRGLASKYCRSWSPVILEFIKARQLKMGGKSARN